MISDELKLCKVCNKKAKILNGFYGDKEFILSHSCGRSYSMTKRDTDKNVLINWWNSEN